MQRFNFLFSEDLKHRPHGHHVKLPAVWAELSISSLIADVTILIALFSFHTVLSKIKIGFA